MVAAILKTCDIQLRNINGKDNMQGQDTMELMMVVVENDAQVERRSESVYSIPLRGNSKR